MRDVEMRAVARVLEQWPSAGTEVVGYASDGTSEVLVRGRIVLGVFVIDDPVVWSG